MPYELISRNSLSTFEDLIGSAEERIWIISPFIGFRTASALVEAINPGVDLRVISRFDREDFIKGVSSLEALSLIINAGGEIFALRGLHTKLYLFDKVHSIITSANFTVGGLVNNFEIGVLFTQETEIANEVLDYFDDLRNRILQHDEDRRTSSKVTKDWIENEKAVIAPLIQSRPQSTKNTNRYSRGATLDATSYADPLEKLFSSSEPYGGRADVWLKFEADSNHRVPNHVRYLVASGPVDPFQSRTYFPTKPRSIMEGDTLYLTVVSYDSSGKGTTIVVGRTKAHQFREDNVTHPGDPAYESWNEHYPYFVELYDIEGFDAEIHRGIPIFDLYRAVSYRTFPSTFSDPSRTPTSIRHYHQRRDKIRITGQAARYLDDELDARIRKYGRATTKMRR